MVSSNHLWRKYFFVWLVVSFVNVANVHTQAYNSWAYLAPKTLSLQSNTVHIRDLNWLPWLWDLVLGSSQLRQRILHISKVVKSDSKIVMHLCLVLIHDKPEKIIWFKKIFQIRVTFFHEMFVSSSVAKKNPIPKFIKKSY